VVEKKHLQGKTVIVKINGLSMDRAIQQRDPGAPELQINPLMSSLRRDPRNAELLKKMHLPT
jgi:hypothetical protein